MKAFRNGLLLIGTSAALGACGAAPDSSLNAVDKKGGWILDKGDESGNQAFNLAKFAKENNAVKKTLGKYSQSGNTYLAFGKKSTFRAEMNMTVQTIGDKSDSASKRQVAAGYWLDSFVFNKKIGDKSDRGLTLDLGAVGYLDVLKLEAAVRFLGQDLYRGETKEAAYENSFTRDFSISATYYPVPLLGLKASGNVGGELGMRIAAGIRRDNALGLTFTPRTTVNGGITGGVTILEFASAEAQGTAMLADLKVGSSANIGMIPSANLAYGSVGIDGGEFKALDGKVDLVAKAGLGKNLPSGVSGKLWSWVLGAIGVTSGWEWRHTIWDPEVLYVAEVPRFGGDFAAFYKKPKNKNECNEKKSSALSKVDENIKVLNDFKNTVSGMEKKGVEAALFYFDSTKERVNKICG